MIFSTKNFISNQKKSIILIAIRTRADKMLLFAFVGVLHQQILIKATELYSPKKVYHFNLFKITST